MADFWDTGFSILASARTCGSDFCADCQRYRLERCRCQYRNGCDICRHWRFGEFWRVGPRLATAERQAAKRRLGDFGAHAQGRLHIIRSSIESQKIIYGRVRTSGALVFAGTEDEPRGGSNKNGILYLVLAMAGHECEAIEQIFINEDPVTLDADGFVTESKYRTSRSMAQFKLHLGSAAQTADELLKSEVTEWTDDHAGKSICYIVCRLDWHKSVWPNGIPQISAIIKGKKLYDPRTGTTAYSTNWALCLRDYLTAIGGLGATTSEIDEASVIVSANVSEESVTLSGGGSQDRYTVNGVVDTAEKPADILKDLASAGAGVIAYSQGRYRVIAGYYEAPQCDAG